MFCLNEENGEFKKVNPDWSYKNDAARKARFYAGRTRRVWRRTSRKWTLSFFLTIGLDRIKLLKRMRDEKPKKVKKSQIMILPTTLFMIMALIELEHLFWIWIKLAQNNNFQITIFIEQLVSLILLLPVGEPWQLLSQEWLWIFAVTFTFIIG